MKQDKFQEALALHAEIKDLEQRRIEASQFTSQFVNNVKPKVCLAVGLDYLLHPNDVQSRVRAIELHPKYIDSAQVMQPYIKFLDDTIAELRKKFDQV